MAATLGMVPLALVVATIGYLLAGWLHTGAVTGLLGTFVGMSHLWPAAGDGGGAGDRHGALYP